MKNDLRPSDNVLWMSNPDQPFRIYADFSQLLCKTACHVYVDCIKHCAGAVTVCKLSS